MRPKHKILIIDDEPANLAVLSRMLKVCNPNYDVITANDGSLGCRLALRDQPDLVMVDWGMPGMSGLDVIKALKIDPATKDIPIIVQTAFSASDVLQTAINAGAMDYLRKPIDRIELDARVKAALLLYDSFRAIKEQKEQIEQQVAELQNLSLVVQKTDNSVMIFDAEGKIEWVNDGFKKMYGYSLDEFKQKFGNTIRDVSRYKDIETSLQTMLDFHSSIDYYIRVQTKYGQWKWIQTTLTPIFSFENELEKIIAIETDITRQKDIEEELRGKNEEMHQITEHLEKMNRLYEQQNIEITREKDNLTRQKAVVEEKKQQMEDILHKILPYEAVMQLKSKGSARPRNYKMATVLFADIKGFTKLCEMLTPEEIVSTLDFHFDKFDVIIEKHNLEKIKTIGDAYMCAGGLPLRNRSNPIDIVLAGLEIQYIMNALNAQRRQSNMPVWELRVGVHTGTLVAGVVGTRKIAYDVWGDTVNISARMESTCEPGKVNVSEVTYEYIKEYFDCNHRGKVEAKNKGKIDMYYIERIKPEYSSDETGIFPNETFQKIINGM